MNSSNKVSPLASVLIDNFKNNAGVIQPYQINLQVYNDWTALVHRLSDAIRGCQSIVFSGEYSVEEKERISVLKKVVSETVNYIGMINGYYLSVCNRIAERLTVLCSTSNVHDSLEFRKLIESYFARLIVVQYLTDQDDILELIQAKRVLRSKNRKNKVPVQSLDTSNRRIAECDLNWKQIYVVMESNPCRNRDHVLIRTKAIIHYQNNTSAAFTIFRCIDCKRYIIDEETYYSIIAIGQPNLYFEYEYDNSCADISPWPDSSLFSRNGYSVSETVGLSAYQRQKILKALIDEGKCTKHDVISYLQNRVSLNSNRQGFNSALTKWKADISYVKQL